MATPSVIASVKAKTTRANVTPTLKNNAPELASRTITCSTAGGVGSLVLPASNAAIHQLARNVANESRRNTLLSAELVKEGSGRQLVGGADNVVTADVRQDAIKNARIGLFLTDRAARDPLAVAVAIDLECGLVGPARQRGNGVPLAVGGRKNLLCLACHLDKARKASVICLPPTFVKDITEHGHGALCAKTPRQILDTRNAPETLAFQQSSEIPVGDGRICLAIEHGGGEQRWCAIDDGRLLPQIDVLPLQRGLQNQPVLVDRATGNRELASSQVSRSLDRGGVRDHHAAKRAGIGVECKACTKRALARHPQEVGDDDVGITRAQGDLAGFGVCKLPDLERQTGLLVEAVCANDRKFPGECPGLLH